jgi:hypothetical protein
VSDMLLLRSVCKCETVSIPGCKVRKDEGGERTG